VKELGEPRAVRIHLEHLSEQISAEDEGRGERSFKRRWFLPIAPYSSCREGATWPVSGNVSCCLSNFSRFRLPS